MKIDLHLYTDHSFDSAISVEQLIDSARRLGLGAIGICDHNTMSAVGLAQKLADGITIIPGMEINTERGTHIIGLFLKDEINAENIFDVIDEIHNQDGLVLVPHPFRARTGLIANKEQEGLYTAEEIAKILSKTDLIEIFNWGCSPEQNEKTERLLEFYPALSQTASTDAHHPDIIGRAYLEFEDFAPENLDELKEALCRRPRFLRYEVYDTEAGWEGRETAVPAAKRSLMANAKKLIPAGLRHSLRGLAKRSSQNQSETGTTPDQK
jgi:predicted metal-dependent phosphoesterase TrpH